MSYYLVNLHDELLRIISNLEDLYSVLPGNQSDCRDLWNKLQTQKEEQKDLLKNSFETFFSTAYDDSIEVSINFFNAINFLNSEILRNISNLFDHEKLSLSYCLKVCLVYEQNLQEIIDKNGNIHSSYDNISSVFKCLSELSAESIGLIKENIK